MIAAWKLVFEYTAICDEMGTSSSRSNDRK